MKVQMKQNIVELVPETEEESKSLEQVWQTIVDCNGPAKKLTPIGEFVPGKTDTAQFVIE